MKKSYVGMLGRSAVDTDLLSHVRSPIARSSHISGPCMELSPVTYRASPAERDALASTSAATSSLEIELACSHACDEGPPFRRREVVRGAGSRP